MTSHVSKAHLLIKQDFNITPDLIKSNGSLEELLEALSKTIAHLINTDFNKLLNLLYRIDIDENKLKNVLSTGSAESVNLRIAQLIVEREIAKVETRKKYK